MGAHTAKLKKQPDQQEVKLKTEEIKGLQQAAVFLTKFSNKVLSQSDGRCEYKVMEFLYKNLDTFEHDGFSKLDKSNDSNFVKPDADVDAVWSFIEKDFSLQKMLKRQLETIKSNGFLISEEDLIKRNLFRKDQFDYIGWSDTTHR